MAHAKKKSRGNFLYLDHQITEIILLTLNRTDELVFIIHTTIFTTLKMKSCFRSYGLISEILTSLIKKKNEELNDKYIIINNNKIKNKNLKLKIFKFGDQLFINLTNPIGK